ncbi:MAG: Kdo hydroxylase family protein [Bryobacteraceae bacterium]
MQIVTIDPWPAEAAADYRPVLEAGNVIFFPGTPFPLPQDAKDFLRNLDFSGGAIHKNIAYRPAGDRVTGIDSNHPSYERLREVLGNYSRTVAQFTGELLPEYARSWKLDYASFRPIEEENRNLPLNKRNDLIHTDAFPSRPTNGNLIMRVFTNIHPAKTRNWVTTDPFRAVAERYARDAGLEKIAAARSLHTPARLLRGLGLPIVPRSPYDRFMLRFHEYLKRNVDFQANCAKYKFDFPPGSTWLTFTDVLPHSVHSGQHALEQTFIIDRHSLSDISSAPLSILERLCGRPLVRN